MAEEEFKERIANFIKCNYGALNVLVNDDGTFEEFQNAEQTEPDHDQPDQRSSDEEDNAGKKKYPVSMYRYKCKDYLWYL